MDILARGVESWNSWRIDNTSIFPDLNGAVLANINLRSANFSHADLSGADLHNADLNHADFRDARVGAAIFRNSFLISADFRRARCGADFTGAVLIDSDLREASFRAPHPSPSLTSDVPDHARTLPGHEPLHLRASGPETEPLRLRQQAAQ